MTDEGLIAEHYFSSPASKAAAIKRFGKAAFAEGLRKHREAQASKSSPSVEWVSGETKSASNKSTSKTPGAGRPPPPSSGTISPKDEQPIVHADGSVSGPGATFGTLDGFVDCYVRIWEQS